jgi:hypothetical protein
VFHSWKRRWEAEMRVRMHPEFGGNVQDPTGRRFIRGLAEDAKFELSRGVIIDPAVEAGFGWI